MSGRGKFGGDAYKPKQLGPEPAAPQPSSATALGSVSPQPEPVRSNADELAALRSVKVPYSSRITLAADQQLKAMARQGKGSQVDLLAEALNLLFKKYGFDQIA
jgi:hypothetical protein